MPDFTSPLNQSHCDCLNQVLQANQQQRSLLRACKDCGLPTDDLEATLDQQMELAKKLKAKFFPMEP